MYSKNVFSFLYKMYCASLKECVLREINLAGDAIASLDTQIIFKRGF